MAVHRQPGTVITDHTFAVPLDHADPGGELIEVYAREAPSCGRCNMHLSFAGNPLYALLHEVIYGQRSVAPGGTNWAAERVRRDFPQFDADIALAGDGPVLFTGETVHPWMFATDPALAPLREAAELLAQREQWPGLYDSRQLAANEVPVVAAIYHDDMYVDTADSLATARAVRGLRTWVTDEYEHDGLRVSGGRVLDRLIRLVRGEV